MKNKINALSIIPKNTYTSNEQMQESYNQFPNNKYIGIVHT